MPHPYTSYKKFTLCLYGIPNRWYRVIYWPTNQRGKRYETMLTDTPAEARRLARLTIASLATIPAPLRRFAGEVDMAIDAVSLQGGFLGG